ncbi:hypothetical protein J4219_07590 [Candidatus Woesearchaeota archaeon]|nr:hypothetical protein [Candidatus Woesearchaeota archaeon]
MKKIVLVALLLLVPSVVAQLDWTITDLRCGNGKLDTFELCDKGLEENETFCDDLGVLLKIDPVCDVQHCTCLPRVNKAYCGNDIREGVELCDGNAEDFCEAYGNITGLNLSCNKDTCGCKISDDLPSDYNPQVVEALENASGKASVCGDKRVERNEECDPPNTLCTTSLKKPGVCTSKCECLEPELLGLEEESDEKNESVEEVEANATSEVVNESDSESETPAEEPEEPGFFSRVWAWIKSLFS